ncbi:hypothetical protein Tfer_2785 [Thermincola ferriacetica]|uniref:Uncharacterized protein n=1 Tax=Thermincola ferriacetica TaxID=281456 RepID=A0A0L6VZQ6_9FIRM|nr:hypothetical protein Tfer_2785 [Thermincola ferriacetica]
MGKVPHAPVWSKEMQGLPSAVNSEREYAAEVVRETGEVILWLQSRLK